MKLKEAEVGKFKKCLIKKRHLWFDRKRLTTLGLRHILKSEQGKSFVKER